MFQRLMINRFMGGINRCLTICLIMAVILSAVPMGLAQATTVEDQVISEVQEASTPVGLSPDRFDVPEKLVESMGLAKDSPQVAPPPMTERQPVRTDFSPLSFDSFDRTATYQPDAGVSLSSDGDFLASSSAGAGSLPGGIEARSLPVGMITVDLTYDVVMGYVNPGELVTVTYLDGYGAAVADGVGFFWTPIWHNTGGYPLGIDCNTSIDIEIVGLGVTSYSLPCITGTVDVLTEQITGTLVGDAAGGTSVTATYSMSTYWGEPQPPSTGAPSATNTTSPGGSFTISFAPTDLGAESMAAVDVVLSGINLRTYLYPQNVFLVEQFIRVGGFAAPGQMVTATVYEGNTSTVRWSSVSNGNWPHGNYSLGGGAIEIGDRVEVALDGGPTMDTIAVAFGNFAFDGALDSLSGIAPDGADVRASLWQWSGEDRLYQEAHATATSGDVFVMGFAPMDLRPRDEVLVVVTDAEGDQVQITSGPPYVNAYRSIDTDLDCVYGRLDGPGLPIVATLDKGAGEVYTRVTGSFSDVGNGLNNLCYTIRDESNNYVNIAPGDIVTIKDDTPGGWAGSVTVVDFAWSGDTVNEIISGNMADGDLEMTLYHFQDTHYPVNGRATQQVPVSGGVYSAGFSSFDVRDGVMVELTHYDPVTGFATQTNNFSYLPTLPFIGVVLPNGVGGMVSSAFEGVTAGLYDLDGTTLLAETSENKSSHPYWFWLDDFSGVPLLPGFTVKVSMDGGWTGEIIIPDLTIAGDVNADLVTASGPVDRLFMEVYDDENSVNQFVPGSNVLLDTANFGWDLQLTDYIAVTHQALEGSWVKREAFLSELRNIGFWLNPDSGDWMWGDAKPGSTVSVYKNGSPFFEAVADSYSGYWTLENSVDISQGDVISVAIVGGLDAPVVITIPDPFTAIVDTETDQLWGQIAGRIEDWVQVHGEWEDGYRETTTDSAGNYAVDYGSTGSDIPKGARGNIYFAYQEGATGIDMNMYFLSPELVMSINYGHDWIESWYPPGYPVTLTVLASDKTTVKATVSMTTSEIPWWDGGTGFSTNLEGTEWVPEQPDIQAGDWVIGEVIVGEDTFRSEVQLGAIDGNLDVDLDRFTGTLDADWLDPLTPVTVQCHPWGAPEGVNDIETTVFPDGVDTFTCDWSGEWDVPPNNDIGVTYQDPGTHWIYNVFQGYSDELMLRVHYDHNWIEGNYEPGHEVHLTVYDSGMVEKASITVPTGPVDDWGGTSGFATYFEGAGWIPSDPDIETGDIIHGEVDDGSQFTTDVQVGLIAGTLDMDLNSISGTVTAAWLGTDPVWVACSIWEENGREVYDTVVPDGLDTYECVFEGDNDYDIIPGTNLMVSYFDPAGHQIFGDFSPPASYLQIQKWLIGDGLGEGSNAAFWVQYHNQGNAPAENVMITESMVGMTYLRDSSGFSTGAVPGDTEVVWDLGTVDPGDWLGFVVFADVTATVGEQVSNTAVITTTSPDKGDEGEKTSTWVGTVAVNNTHLNVGKETWTWNPAPGENFVYKINVCNNGSTSSSEVTLTETLPSTTTFFDWWGGDQGWSEVDLSGNPLIFEHTCISSYSCSELYIVTTVDPLANPGDALHNHVDIFAENDLEHDDDTTDLDHNVGEPYTDLNIWQNWHGGSLTPGGYYRYGIYVKNESNLSVSGPIEITATLPVGTSFAGWDSWDAADSIPDPVVDGNTVTWQMGNMIAGGEGAIEVWVDIDPDTVPGTMLNHLAEVEIQPDEENTDNNSSVFAEYVRDHGPNLRVTKWGDWHGGQEGQSAWWNIQLENIGDQTMDDVVLIDYYPDGMELDGGLGVNYGDWWDWADNDPEDNAFKIQFDRLEPGWGAGINYNTYVREEVVLTPAMEFSNTVDVTMPDDIEPINNIYEHILVYIGDRPHLWIDKQFFGDNVGEGGNAAFWVKYQNQGGLAAEGVTITDTLEGMTYLSDTSGFPATIDGNQVTWDLGTVEPSDNWIGFVVFAEVTETAGGSVSNTVHIITSTPYDEGDEWEKTSTWEGTVATNNTHMNVGKETWTWNPAPGADFVYKINVCNNGSTGSSEVTLTETLPLNTTYVTWWSTDLGWEEVDQIGQTLELEQTCVSSYSCSEVYVVVTVDPAANPGDALHNHVEIFAENDLEHDDDTADLYHNVGEPNIDLGIWHGWHGGSLTPGGQYRYGLYIKNEGNVGVSGPIEVTATLPTGTSFAGWDSWDAADSIPDPVVDGNTVTWQIGDMIAGGQGVIEVWVDINPDTIPGTVLEHLAEIETQPGEGYVDNNSSTMTEMVYGSGPNLRIHKQGGIHGYGDGHYIGYRLNVENVGDVTIENVLITDTYPAGMTLDGDLNINFWEPWERVLYADHFDVTLSKLEPGWSMQIDYSTHLADIVPGVIYENIAQVQPMTGDMNPDDNTASFSFGAGPDMYVEKELDSGTFLPGEHVTYRLTFGNLHHDNDWWWDMTGNAVLTDTLPVGMSFVSATMHWCESSEWCDIPPSIVGQELTWELYPIGRSYWNEIYLTVQIAGEIGETNPLINQVSITSTDPAADADPYPDNNTSQYDPELVAEAPVITSDDHTTFTVGIAGNFDVTTAGNPVPEILFTGALPTGVTLVDDGDGTATLSGTPAVGTGGTYALVITASNGVLPDATQNFTLTINEAPTITSTATTTFKVGTAGTFTITTAGYPDPALTYTGTLPGGVTLIDNGDGTATLSGTPNVATGGVYNLVITANNGVTPNATQNFTLTINEAPAITSANATSFKVGTAGTFTITTTGYPIPAITYGGSQSDGVFMDDNGDGTATLQGTPGVGTGGIYDLVITASNGVTPNATQNFTLTVNEAPTITSTAATTFKVGTAGTFTITTAGYPDPALTYTGSLPGGVTLIDNGGGTATLSGTPNAGTGGVYNLVITANNGVTPNATQNFTMTVNEAPKIISDDHTTFIGGVYNSFTIETTGYPTPTIVSGVFLGEWLTLVDQGDGTAILSGIPPVFNQEQYFVITAMNGVDPNAEQNFTLTVVESSGFTVFLPLIFH